MRSSMQVAWKTSAASSGGNPYLTGMEKIRALYLSIRPDQASSFPARHSFTSRESVHDTAGVFFSLIATGITGPRLPAHFASRVARRSTKHTAQGPRDGSCPPCSSRRPGYPGWQEKSWAVVRRGSPERDRRASSAPRRFWRRAAAPSDDRSRLPTRWRGGLARDSIDACPRWKAKHWFPDSGRHRYWPDRTRKRRTLWSASRDRETNEIRAAPPARACRAASDRPESTWPFCSGQRSRSS